MALYTLTNQITNPRFGAGAATNWAVNGGGTIAATTTKAYSGTYSGMVSVTNGGAFGPIVFGGALTSGAFTPTKTSSSIPVTAGTTYGITAVLQCSTTLSNKLTIWWFDSAGTYLSNSQDSSGNVSTAWTVLTYSATAPANAAFAVPGINPLANSGNSIYIGGMYFGLPGAYFDGGYTATADYSYAWTGTADASTSTQAKLRRTNFETNGGFEGTLANWNGGLNANLAISTAQAHTGTRSLGATMTGTPATLTRSVLDTGQVLGSYYTLSTWIYTTSTGVSAYLALYNPTAGALTNGNTTPLTANAWTKVLVQGQFGSDGGSHNVRVVISGTASGQVHYVDDLIFEQSYTDDGFFDGATTTLAGFTCAWTGAANASTSTATPSSGSSLSTTTTASATVATGLSAAFNLATSASASATAATGLSPGFSLNTAASAGVTVSTSLSGGGQLSPSVSAGVTASTAVSAGFNITPAVSVGVTVTTSLAASGMRLSPSVAAAVSVWTSLQTNPRIASAASAEVTILTDLVYDAPPLPLDAQPLGKLLDDFQVDTTATPSRVGDAAGGVPIVKASFTAGRNPETAMGAQATLVNPAVGTWAGEVSGVKTSNASNIVGVGIDTPMVRLGAQRRVYPIIGASSVWTHARAVEYWTQAAGMFYRAVPGRVAFYQSCWHPYAYGDGLDGLRFMERGAAPTVADSRSWLGYGNSTVAVVAGVANIPVLFGQRKIAAGVTFRLGTTGSVKTRFVFTKGHTLDIACTSTGAVTVTVDGVSTVTASGTGTFDAIVSLERVSDTAITVRLTTGTADTKRVVVPLAIPSTLYLDHVEHTGTGDTLRADVWLTVTDKHPAAPATQKKLQPVVAGKDIAFVAGFVGPLWAMLQEFCAIYRLDLSYSGGVMTLGPRGTALTQAGPLAITRTANVREKYRQVAVVNLRSKPVSDGTALLWRPDSKTQFSVSPQAPYETTVSTGHSILDVNQPVCVTAITPFPYTGGAGQYVVKDANGDVVDPAWWASNGGKVEVSLTDHDGELKVKITSASYVLRAPYRLTFGAEDRPALYITGSAVINNPQTVTVATCEADGREGYYQVFSSPFLATSVEAYAAAMDLAIAYSSSVAAYTVEDATNVMGGPSRFGVAPAGARIHDGKRVLRVSTASQKVATTSVTVEELSTWADAMASMPSTAVFGDEFARHSTFAESAISPLQRTV